MRRARLTALAKILLFDLTLFFDAYVHSLMEELVKAADAAMCRVKERPGDSREVVEASQGRSD